MNALRTIQKEEDAWWVDLLLREGPHQGNDVPDYPPWFPFPFRIQRPLEAGYLYVVYRSKVHAYGRIATVLPHRGSEVGTDEQPVSPGDKIVLDGPMARFPFALPCRGFVGIRYTVENLHDLSPDLARQVIRQLKLEPE
jgi:hypothetical protein